MKISIAEFIRFCWTRGQIYSFNPFLFFSILNYGQSAFALPARVQVEPTSYCNLNCIMCPRHELKRSQGNLSFENFKKVLRDIPSAKFLLLAGIGEPLMNKELPEMVGCAKEKNIPTVQLFTNGSLLNKKNADSLVSSRLDIINFSVDAGSKKTYGRIRKGSFDSVLSGMEAIVNAKKEQDSKKPETFFSVVLQKDNVSDLSNIVELYQKSGLDNLSIKGIRFFGQERMAKFFYTKADRKKAMESIKEGIKKARELNRPEIEKRLVDILFMLDKPYMSSPEQRVCIQPWFATFIRWNGDVLPCCFCQDEQHVLGNVFEQGFKEIWNGEKYKKFRKTLREDRDSIPACRTCIVDYNNLSGLISIRNKLRL